MIGIQWQANRSVQTVYKREIINAIVWISNDERIVVYYWYLGNVYLNRKSETFYRVQNISTGLRTVVVKEVLCRGSTSPPRKG